MARAGPKKKAKTKTLTPEEQRARFVKAAKEAEVDERPDALDRAFSRLDARKKSTITRVKRVVAKSEV